MLLSLFTSFLLTRMSRKKLYVLFMAIALFLISFFSVGVPESVTIPNRSFQDTGTEGLMLNDFHPLSFPFYSSVYQREPVYFHDVEWEEYRLNFVTMTLYGTRILYESNLGAALSFSWIDYILYFSLFLLVNIAGAVVGYWISNRRWLYSGVLISIVVLAPLILLYNPFLPIWNPPRPEVTMTQGYWSDLVYMVDTTVKNNGGGGWIAVYVVLSATGTPMGSYYRQSMYFSRGESKTLQIPFEGFHPPISYRTWAEAD